MKKVCRNTLNAHDSAYFQHSQRRAPIKTLIFQFFNRILTLHPVSQWLIANKLFPHKTPVLNPRLQNDEDPHTLYKRAKQTTLFPPRRRRPTTPHAYVPAIRAAINRRRGDANKR